MLYIVASYHRMQFPEKLMIETQENDKKPQFGPDLDPLSPNSDRQLFFFSKICFVQSLNIMASYHPILRKSSHVRTDGQTDRQTDESDFRGHYPANVEIPENGWC